MTGLHRVATGLDVLAADRFKALRGRRVGAIANPTSVDARLRHLADLLHDAEGVDLVALFGPEHGVRGDAQDMIRVHPEIDAKAGVPVHSLYGSDLASLSPTADQLSRVDLLVFDVQDVGSRYYTFAATMLYAMQEASRKGIAVLVLDRPNPIGGEAIEGPIVRPEFESFVGPHPVPIRHGMTVGELALLFRAERGLDLDLEVIPCVGLSRGMLWPETGLPWVMPSPNMPAFETALVYPGACLIEGTNLSEGRGTTRPFELWGAPWLDPGPIAADAERHEPGAIYRPCSFRPTFHKHAGATCQGVQAHVIDPASFRPVELYTRFLARALAQDPGRFSWRTEPYEFVRDPIAIDLLFGSPREREAIEAGTDPAEIARSWRADETAFRERRGPYLLYDG